ncbi:MAG: AAA family ATPase [Methermicoccaceae archaeon]
MSETNEDVLGRTNELFSRLFDELGNVIVGQKDALEQLIISIMCNGHALVESNPGLGKTLMIFTLAKLMDLKFSRVQCTPDLMPSDITGTYILEETGEGKQFRFEAGPVFANIVLADEINRATPKTQSALLEAMQERQVTAGGQTFALESPFFVLATQNPIEMEGTFPLPEAQLDRFLFKIKMGYPSPTEEMEIVNRYTTNVTPEVRGVISKDSLLKLQMLTREVPISNELKQLVINIITATRMDIPEIAYGASPRASIGLILAAKARAFVHGRSFVSHEDVETMTYPVLRHRIILTFEAERRGITPDIVISKILDAV